MLEHRLRVSDVIQRKRTWAACACPVCRFVFRVPKQHEGKGVVCPACLYLLKLPQKGNTLEDIQKVSNANLDPSPRGEQKAKAISARPMAQAEPLSSEEASGHSRSSRSSGRRRVRGQREVKRHTPEWEQETEASHVSSEEGSSPVPWFVGGGLLGLTIVAVGAWLVMGATDNNKVATDEAVTDQWVPDNTVAAVDNAEPERTDEEQELHDQVKEFIDTGSSILEESETVIKKFLAVKNVEDFRSLIRDPEKVMPRIEAWYKERPLGETKVKEVGYGDQASVSGNLGMINILMNDYSTKQMAIEKTQKGYKVDWESWVGWTEMAWEQLFEKRPEEPQIVLVRCVIDTYYNRQFNDDKKWIAVKMSNPQFDRTLYGYVDREDPKLIRFVRDIRNGGGATRLKIRYPENALADNQVIITEYISNGWVTSAEETEDDKEE